MVCLHTCGHRIYIVNEDKYPWIINSDVIAQLDTAYVSTVDLLTDLKKEGLVLSPQEFTSQTHSYFSWLLTVLVAVIGILTLVFGYNIDKRIKEILDKNIKNKWLELMRVDKEVDSTIGGVIDDHIDAAISDIKSEIGSLKERLDSIEGTAITFTDNSTEEE
jgi:hypothetical protein